MRKLFYVTQHDPLTKWETVTLVKYWQLDNSHLNKLEAITFLERVKLVLELARYIESLREEIKKASTVQGVLEILLTP